ncbi:MAG: porin [Burkholderiaceae bacterium]|nr:porin [Burkholderiaceae bacterium]MCD8517873.1 porin [Burkholderiaceae bacterium]MCD8538301.1 porin [Burkholderiaceae bacterium]MCD8565385.1 porin [Burkholderiaceae bacterium]
MPIYRLSLTSLLVLAASGLSPAAAAESSVTLYGLVDMGLAYQTRTAGSQATVFANPGKDYSQFGLASGQSAASRWGMKGTEDLGNGLKANFVLEAAVNMTDGSSSGFTRQSTMGLSKDGLGSVDLGRRLSPGTYAFAGIDPFDYNYDQAALNSSMGATNIRFSNMIALTTASYGGLSFLAGWSFDTGLRGINSPVQPGVFGTSNKYRALSLGARYQNGPLLLGAMFDTYYSPSGPGSMSVKQWNVGGTYDFKIVKLHAAFGQNIDGRVNGVKVLANAETSGGDGNTNGAVFYEPGARTNQWMVGVSAPVGSAGKVFASVQQLRPGGDFTFGDRGSQTTSSIGYNYSLSKRTMLYAYYSYMTAPDMYAGANSQILGAGIQHKF